jgi:CTP synthase (UTP-ammonia lyase)
MRLGAYPAKIKKGTMAYSIYKKSFRANSISLKEYYK